MIAALTPLELFLCLAAPFIGSWVATLSRAWPQLPTQLARSVCDACQVSIPSWRMVPVLSFLSQQGRCHRCDAPISALHPIGELACLLGAGTAVLVADGASAVAGCALAWLLVYASLVDARTLQLPDWSSASIAVLGAGLALSSSLGVFVAALGGALIAGALLLGLRAGWRKVSGREALGLGDVKLSAACAFWLSPMDLAPAIALGGIVTLLAIMIRGDRERPIAFGPGLAFGFFMMWALPISRII